MKANKIIRYNFITYAVVLIFIIGLLITGGVLYKKTSNIRKDINAEISEWMMSAKKTDISMYEPLKDEEEAWYTKYHFIAHAGGAIEGRLYTNSLEAWEHAYELGNRVFDADIEMTSDGLLVLRHSWNDNLETTNAAMHDSYRFIDMNGCQQYTNMGEIMNYEKFIETPIFHKYHSMSEMDMLEFMNLHKDLYVTVDMKVDPVTGYQKLVNIVKDAGYEDILNRIIVNIYDYEMYDRIMEVYPFENVVARQHYIAPNNYYELAEFCLKNEIHVVNISSCYIENKCVKMLRDKGIHIYVAIVDYISDMKEYHNLYGADGAVTNLLYEDDWKYIEQ